MGIVGRPSFNRKKIIIEDLQLLLDERISSNKGNQSFKPKLTAFKKKYRMKNLEDVFK